MTTASTQSMTSNAVAERIVMSDVVQRAPSRADVTRFDFIFTVAAALGELMIVALSLTTASPADLAFVLHLILIIALGGALYRRHRAGVDLSAPLLVLIATFAAGPMGAVAGFIMLAWLARPAHPAVLLQAWYDRIALSTSIEPETLLADRVASGRVIDTSAPPPQALVSIVQLGTLEERQAALGLIARQFHLRYLDALSEALRSDVAVIRVQAAAVASRIRPRLAREVNQNTNSAAELLRDISMPSHRGKSNLRRMQLIRDLDSAIQSKLLDKPVNDTASEMAARLAASLDCLTLSLQEIHAAEARTAIEALEARLLAGGEFKRLRVLRRRQQIARRGLVFAVVRVRSGLVRCRVVESETTLSPSLSSP